MCPHRYRYEIQISLFHSLFLMVSLKKNLNVEATWDVSFQCSILNRNDPLSTKQLEGIGLHTVPSIGVFLFAFENSII